MAYGYSYRGYQGADEHPLAAAIQNALSTGLAVFQMRRDVQEQQRRARMDAEDRAFRREQWDYGTKQDTLARQERDRARNDQMAREAADRGLTFLPSTGTFGGTGGGRFVKTGPSRIEREAVERAGVTERLERPELEASARALGLDTGLNSPDLRVAIQRAMAAQETAAKDAASARDLQEQKDLKAAPSYADLHPDPAVAENRRMLTEGREQLADQRATAARKTLADRYIEATGGDVNRAWHELVQYSQQDMGDPRAMWTELRAAAQRYQDRRNPPRTPSAADRIAGAVESAIGDDADRAPASTGASAAAGRPATDEDILAAVRAVGQDEAAVRKWLKDRGIDPGG